MAPTSKHVALAIALVFAMGAQAEAKQKAKPKKDKKAQEAPPPKATEDKELLQKGHAAFLIRDYDKAEGFYKKAAEVAAKSPEVHYYLGCVLKARGEFDDAVESFRTAYLMATGKDEAWKSPALVQVAFTHEAAGNWKEAKKAWKDYIDYAKGKSLVINATSLAEERIEAIDKMMDLDKQYAPVRKLIEEQKKGAD